MKKERNVLKRYFLSRATSRDGPFLSGFLIGVSLAVLTSFGVLWRAPKPLGISVTLWMLTVVGVGVVLGTINSVVCRRFVRYSKEPGLFFLTNGGPIRLDEEGRAIGANPLWGKGLFISLPRTDQPYEKQVLRRDFPETKIPLVVLRVFFKGEFDPHEVYQGIYRSGFDPSSFNRSLSSAFLHAVRNAGEEEVFYSQAYELPPDEIEAKLGKVRSHFTAWRDFSNIDHIDLEVSPTVTISFN